MQCDSLQLCVSVVGSLECVVRRCLGPDGGSVLFTRDTGDTLITRHGQHILSTLHLQHPMARMVLECVFAHAKATADGTKSFILLLAALLRGIQDSAHKHSKGSFNIHMPQNQAHRLLELSWMELGDVIEHQIVPYASVYCSLHGNKPESSVLDLLVGGYLAGRVGPSQADILRRILCEFYHKVSQGQDTEETISFLQSHFSLLHTPVSGLPIGCSEVIEGMIVTRDWSVWTEPEGPAKALVVYESFGPPFIATGDNISVCIQQHWMPRCESILQQELNSLLHLQVCVVLSSVKQPECVLQWACLNHIAILECVDSAQLDLLCQISSADTPPHPRHQHLVTLKFCRRVQLGGHSYACLGTFPQGVLQTHTLALCGPAPGLLDQTVRVSQGVFTMLRHLYQSTINKQTHSQSDAHNHLAQQTVTDSVCQTQERLNKPFQSSIPASDQSQSSSLDQSQISPSSQDLWGRIVRAGGVFPVGGMFEFLLHHFLLNGRNHGDSESCRLLAEALLCVPRTLYSHSRRHFLNVQTHLLSDLKQWNKTKVQGSEVALGTGSGLKFRLGFNEGLESVSGKHQLVVSVLQCLNRLLCVGAILQTRSPLNTRSHPDSEEEEEEENLNQSSSTQTTRVSHT